MLENRRELERCTDTVTVENHRELLSNFVEQWRSVKRITGPVRERLCVAAIAEVRRGTRAFQGELDKYI